MKLRGNGLDLISSVLSPEGGTAQTDKATDSEVASSATMRVMVDRVRNARYSLQSGFHSGSDEAKSLIGGVSDDGAGDALRMVEFVLWTGIPVTSFSRVDSIARQTNVPVKMNRSYS